MHSMTYRSSVSPEKLNATQVTSPSVHKLLQKFSKTPGVFKSADLPRGELENLNYCCPVRDGCPEVRYLDYLSEGACLAGSVYM